MLELLAGSAELLVLARYMQVLSREFLEGVGMPAINIHDSFLPAFAGADPYRRARTSSSAWGDVERLVLARAVGRHLEDRAIVDGRRTVVF
jgi:formyltetrahydrofolate deformylase